MTERRVAPTARRLLMGLAVLLFVELALLLSLFAFPGFAVKAQQIVTAAAQAWSGTAEEAGVRAELGSWIQSAYSEVVEPLKPLPPPGPPDAEQPLFSGCVSCHTDYAESKRFRSSYMDHPLHAELGVTCATCHEDVEHPDPEPPRERTCASCHQEDVRRGGNCRLCHPPGSLPHFYLLGVDREGPVECTACHIPSEGGEDPEPPALVRARVFDGSDETECASCHVQAKCDSCHAEPHTPEWISEHGEDGSGWASWCSTCHTPTWCGERCHSRQPSSQAQPAEDGRP
jgi:hypothetical protein